MSTDTDQKAATAKGESGLALKHAGRALIRFFRLALLPGRSLRRTGTGAGTAGPSLVLSFRGFNFAKYRVAPRLGTEAVRRRLAGQMRRTLMQLRIDETRV